VITLPAVRARSSFAALIAVVGFALVACKPAVGSSCTRGEARCIDPARALVCEEGKFIETPCNGKLGCRLQPEGTACDVHGNKAGDRCSKDEEGAAVCGDAETMLVCRGGTTVRAGCRGKGGCVEEHGRAACDASIAEEGDPCGAGSKSACSVSGKEVLVCVGAVMKKTYECRGERGCSVASGKIDCDQSVAKVGDGCDPRLEGSFACTEDHKGIVKCAGSRFVADETCKAGTQCLAEPGSTRCGKPEKA
jgi:hypothetical protein